MTIQEVCLKMDLTQDTLRYYEKVGMIPPVGRTSGGTRNYGEEDLRWISLAKCLRAAGLPVQAIVEYVYLFRLGDETVFKRLALLKEQRDALLDQRRKMDEAIEKLEYKISRYENGLITGRVEWNKK